MIKYITRTGEEQFKTFKYNGGNDSLLYQHLWSPLAEKLLLFTPQWLAPNLITLISAIMMTTVHIVFVFLPNNIVEKDVKLTIMGISILIYLNLDNLDGKQARKTKSSSPLGMLFDHGTDALCSFFISIQVIQMLQVQNQILKIFCLFSYVMIVYFSAMWSQYSIGYFRLGQINPVDQGLPSYALVTFICIFLPQNFWNQQGFVLKINQQLLLSLSVLVVLIVYNMVKDNFSKAVRPKNDILGALLLPLTYALILGALIINKPQALQNQFPLYYCLLFSWSRNMIQIQVYFVTKQKFNPFNAGTLSFVIPALAYNWIDHDATEYFTIVSIICGIFFFQFVVSLLRQGSQILNISIFTIKKQSNKYS